MKYYPNGVEDMSLAVAQIIAKDMANKTANNDPEYIDVECEVVIDELPASITLALPVPGASASANHKS